MYQKPIETVAWEHNISDMTSKKSVLSSHTTFIQVLVKKVKCLRMSPEKILEFDEQSSFNLGKAETQHDEKWSQIGQKNWVGNKLHQQVFKMWQMKRHSQHYVTRKRRWANKSVQLFMHEYTQITTSRCDKGHWLPLSDSCEYLHFSKSFPEELLLVHELFALTCPLDL